MQRLDADEEVRWTGQQAGGMDEVYRAQDVVRLQIAVHDARRMCGHEGVAATPAASPQRVDAQNASP
jgi:hypothetical protein